MTPDHAGVVAEVTACFERYEDALARNDLRVLRELFWDDPAVVRFGVDDQQYGADELARWRGRQPPLPGGRALERTTVTAFGPDTAVVSTLFTYPGGRRLGRQSQTWVRIPACGWRIVHAHVSEVAATPARPAAGGEDDLTSSQWTEAASPIPRRPSRTTG